MLLGLFGVVDLLLALYFLGFRFPLSCVIVFRFLGGFDWISGWLILVVYGDLIVGSIGVFCGFGGLVVAHRFA